MSSCIFCEIVAGKAGGEILFQDDEIMVFKDIKPASKFHFLAIPKEHVVNVKSLSQEHTALVKHMIAKSKEILSQEGGDLSDARLGFHLPPFNSVSHLHLHVISPASDMSFLNRMIFKPESWWFSSVEQVVDQLANNSKL